MEPALPLPLRLDLAHPPVPTSHETVSEQISHFLSAYAARTGTQNAASSSSDDPSTSSSAGSTGGVVAAQLTRLMNGLAGKIDYDIFANLFPTTATSDAIDMDEHDEGEMETPAEILEGTRKKNRDAEGDGEGKESFSKTDELIHAETPTVHDSLRRNPIESHHRQQESPKKKDKKDKKDKKNKKDKKEKKKGKD